MTTTHTLLRGVTLGDLGRVVYLDSELLSPCPCPLCLGPRPRRWGRVSQSARLLARDILYAALADSDAAHALTDDYAEQVVYRLPAESWTLPISAVLTWVASDPARAVWLGLDDRR